MDKETFIQWLFDNYNVPGDNTTLAPDMLYGILDFAQTLKRPQQLALFEAVFPDIPDNVRLAIDIPSELITRRSLQDFLMELRELLSDAKDEDDCEKEEAEMWADMANLYQSLSDFLKEDETMEGNKDHGE